MAFLRNPYLLVILCLILVLLDFRQGGYDLLPDVLGYGLLVLSLLMLRQQDGGFGRLVPLTLIIAALAALDFRTESVWFARYGDVDYFYNPLCYIQWVRMALEMLLVWQLSRIWQRVATLRQLPRLAESSTERASLFITAMALAIGAEAFYIIMPQMQFYVLPISDFVEFVGWGMLIELAWQMSRQLRPEVVLDATS